VLDDDNSLFYSYEEKGNYLVTTDLKLGHEAVCLDDLEMQVQGDPQSLWEFWDIKYSNKCELDFWEKDPGQGEQEKIYVDDRFKSIGKVNWKTLYIDNKVDVFLDNGGHTNASFESSQDYDISIFFRYALRFNR
jgi:hypothetical protein